MVNLNPELDFNPHREARRLAAQQKIAEGKWLVRKGEALAAIATYEQAERILPDLKMSIHDWNYLCYFSSLWGHAAEVLKICDYAVALAPHNCDIRRTRGIARAITGNFDGAIEDFQIFIDRILVTERSDRDRLAEQWRNCGTVAI